MEQVPPNPKHGEPGHDCPLDHWFEIRLKGVDIAMIDRALDLLQQIMQARIVAEALTGTMSPDELDRLIRTGEEMEELQKRLNSPLDKEYKEMRSEWHKYKEFHL